MPRGYGWAEHPNNSPRDGTIHPIAQQQLLEWQAIAERWHYSEENRYDDYLERDREVVACGYCSQNLWFVRDDEGRLFEYSREQLLALTVAHIRQRHPEAINGNI